MFVYGGLCFHDNRGNSGMKEIKATDSKRFVPSSCKSNSPGISYLLVTVVYFFCRHIHIFPLHSSQATEMHGMGSLTCWFVL